MSWRNRLRKASFRGVPFFVDTAARTVGRKIVQHKYPLRDEPFNEDLGRDTRQFTITAYVLGANYIDQAEAVETVCEAGQKGVLIHPTKGSIDVVCLTATLTESRDDGGYCAIQIEFVEAGLQQFPAASVNSLSKIASASGGLISSSRLNFLKAITVSNVPEFVTGGFQGSVSSIGGVMDLLQGSGGIFSSFIDQDLINESATFFNLIGQLKSASLPFITQPDKVADTIQQSFASAGRLSPTPQAAVVNYDKIRTGMTVETRTQYTDLVALENQNKTATKRFNDVVAVANQANYVPLVNYPSYEEALAARNAFLKNIDALTDDTTDDDEYSALQTIRTEIANAVPGRDSDAPHIVKLQLKQPIPALVLAYNLYEDASRDQEIVDRNKQSNPGFISSEKPIEVLSA